MPVEQLILKDEPIEFRFYVNDKGRITVATYFGLDVPRAIATFNRNQADLLRLWLEEHLK